MEKKVLQIPNISCGHCTKTIENELNELSGVHVVESNITDKTVTVQWEQPATLDVIIETLKEINYPVK